MILVNYMCPRFHQYLDRDTCVLGGELMGFDDSCQKVRLHFIPLVILPRSR